jgi:hypothetical protein
MVSNWFKYGKNAGNRTKTAEGERQDTARREHRTGPSQ